MLKWMDSFQAYSTSTSIAQRYSARGNVTLTPGGGRSGGTSVAVDQGSLKHVLPTTQSEVVAGVALKVDNLQTATAVLSFENANGVCFVVYANITGGFYISYNYGNPNFGGDAGLGSTVNNLIVPGSFGYLEVDVLFSTTAGSFTLRWNGVNVLTGANVNTNGNNATVGASIVGKAYSLYYHYTDYYILDKNGSANTTFLGDVLIGYSPVNSNGRVNQFTPTPSGNANYSNVSAMDPSGSSYNATNAIGATDTYGVIAPTGSNLKVFGVSASTLVFKDVSGTRTASVGLGNGTTEDYSKNSGFALGTGPQLQQAYYDTNPFTSAAWTEANLTGLQVALQLAS